MYGKIGILVVVKNVIVWPKAGIYLCAVTFLTTAGHPNFRYAVHSDIIPLLYALLEMTTRSLSTPLVMTILL
jgi:hypothetical protein